MASDLYSQIMNDRGSLERMMARIPGFEGYLDRAARRKADRMLRDHLAGELDQRINRLARIERALLDKTGLAHMAATNAVKTRLQTYRDRIKTAAPGYSGFFDAVRIDSEELEWLYGFDELQVVYADRLAGALDTLEQAVNEGGDVEAALRDLDNLVREADDAFSQREQKLLNLNISG
ncbi:MAG: hypothetical protein DIU68_013680 [Chloroflexota bacterium]|nr:MAG: hypothetical protein DIU68_06425 [Chloroflexota bacterium]